MRRGSAALRNTRLTGGNAIGNYCPTYLMCSLLESASSNSKTELKSLQTSARRSETPRCPHQIVYAEVMAIIRLSYYSFPALSCSSTTVLKCHETVTNTNELHAGHRWSAIFVNLSGQLSHHASWPVATQYRLRHYIWGCNRLRHNRSRTRENNTPKENMPQYAVLLLNASVYKHSSNKQIFD